MNISDDFLRKYQEQIRKRNLGSPAGFEVLQNDLIVRYATTDKSAKSNCIIFSNFLNQTESHIHDQMKYFADRESEFTWQVYDCDQPSDLGKRLSDRGFTEQEAEYLLGLDLDICSFKINPNVKAIDDLRGFALLDELFSSIWDPTHHWVRGVVKKAIESHSKNFRVYAYMEGDRPLSAGWMRFHDGTDFASLWGGMTLPEYQGRGLYTETVKHRCNIAKASGFKYMAVGAWLSSRPALLKIGFKEYTRISNFVWKLGH